MANDQLSVCLLFVMGEEVFSQRDPSFHYYYFRNMLFKTKHTKWGTNLTQLDYSLSTFAGEEPSSCWVTIAGVQEISVTHIHSPIFFHFSPKYKRSVFWGLHPVWPRADEPDTGVCWTFNSIWLNPNWQPRAYSSSTAQKQTSFIYNFLFLLSKKNELFSWGHNYFSS